MTGRISVQEALLAQEAPLSDLQAILSALDLIASASQGIERDDMNGLRIVTRYAKEIASALHHSWKNAIESSGQVLSPDGSSADH